jgi:BirA family biotin operon repressor/biotin-[acetyl-CoA-carboxylase] ligase
MIHQYKNFIIHKFHELPSSNDKAFELFEAKKIFDQEVIWTLSQNKGRGREGRSWDSPIGNLYFSFTLKTNQKLELIPQISFVAICALNKTLNYFFNEKNIKVSIKNKWPNDLLINEHKVAGILLESKIVNNICEIIVVGIGVNLISNPVNSKFKSANISQFGCDILPQNCLEIFLDNFQDLYLNWLNFGFANIRKLWLSNAYNIGKTIEFNSKNNKIEGIFEDIDNLGGIIIKYKNDSIIYNFGEIINFNN